MDVCYWGESASLLGGDGTGSVADGEVGEFRIFRFPRFPAILLFESWQASDGYNVFHEIPRCENAVSAQRERCLRTVHTQWVRRENFLIAVRRSKTP